jgi:hypothetical protein
MRCAFSNSPPKSSSTSWKARVSSRFGLIGLAFFGLGGLGGGMVSAVADLSRSTASVSKRDR